MSQTVAGYEVGETISRSRRFLVHRALGPEGERVVIKTASSEYPSQHDLDRLRQEHKILSRIGHPGVISAISLCPFGHSLALVLEHVPGLTLEETLTTAPMPLGEFLPTAIALADALAAVHDAEVIHKDLNPSNIMIHPATRVVKLLGFGVASLLPRESPAAQSPEALEGTLPYMSPEQTGRMNRSLDYRTDLYSLGVLFYRLLTGQLPFDSDDPMEIIHHHIARPPESPMEVAQHVSPTLSHIVLRLMAKTPENRYQSAAGLRADLDRCFTQLSEDGVIGNFSIGSKDISTRFQIPEKLYGREVEIERILGAFEKAGLSGCALMLVAGYSGVGKSRLVQELQKPIVQHRGHFISGKFEQYKQNVPFAPLQEAFRELIRRILTESDTAIAEWRQRLLDAFGPNGQLIVEMIPEIEFMVGHQEPITELPPQQAQNRFLQVFRSFVRVCCRREQPLCLFLDDLQWVDSATLSWLEETLNDPEIRSLFIIGTYRDNEVGPSHPLMVTLDRLSERGAAIDRLELKPLDVNTLGVFVADTLRHEVEETRELSRLLYSKTHGNPFFVNQLLVSLHEQGALQFDQRRLHWVPDLEGVNAIQISDNIIDVMVSRVQRLRGTAQETLCLASCIGNSFNIGLLAVVVGKGNEEIGEDLSAALRLGLVSHVGGLSNYQFVHDRVQQAAYSLLSEERAKAVHSVIGHSILERSENPAQDDSLFDALQHLDFAIDLIESDEQRMHLTRLNFVASVRARSSTAYSQALTYIKAAMRLLSESATEDGSRLPFELTLERAECEHLSGNDAAATQWYDRALGLAGDDLERARVYEKQIHFFTNTAQFAKAYAVGRTGAALFGVNLPEKFSLARFIAEYTRIKLVTQGRPAVLAELPEMKDKNLLAATRIATAALKAAYQVRPELCVAVSATLVQLCLKYGNFKDCPVAYLPVGPIFHGGIRGKVQAGFDWGQLCLALLDRFNNVHQKSEVNFVYAYFANSWTRPYESTEDYYRNAYRAGVETGDFFHASCAASAIVQSIYMRGVPFDIVIEECDRYLDFLTHIQSRENIGTLQAVRQTILNLRGETVSRTSYSVDGFDEEAYVDALKGYGSPHFAHYYFVNKIQALYLWHEYERAAELAAKAAPYLTASLGMQHTVEHYFLEGLLAAQLSRWGTLWKAVWRFRGWARRCPENFLHKELLLRAELARLTGNKNAAAVLYDQAIETADRNGFLQVQALANELSGRFHARRGLTHAAGHYLRDACYSYRRWGATALAAKIAQDYHNVLPIGTAVGTSLGEVGTSVGTGNVHSELDVATILKSSEAISGEVQLPELLSKLIAIVIENAGADRGLLLLPNRGDYFVQAEGRIGQDQMEVQQGIRLSEYAVLPRSIINFVVRSRKPVVLDDATRPGQFSRDPYFVPGPRSVLCAPLLHRGNLNGIIYLENGLTTGVFTEERVRLLQLLSGQFAISIQNAFVYERLEQEVKERTIQLESRNRLIRRTFGRYLSEEVVEELLEAPTGLKMGGENRVVTIMIVDLRGFTALSEQLSPQQVVLLVNNFLGVMTDVIMHYAGTIDEFIGDGIMAIFGAPILRDDDAERAVACAVAMQLQMSQVNSLNRGNGLPEVAMGIGLNTGEVVVGNIGSIKRAKYGVVGGTVNVASRIEACTTPGQILVSAQTIERAGATVETGQEFETTAKGLDTAIRMFEVTGVAGGHGLRLPTKQHDLVSLRDQIPIQYCVLEDKHTVGEVRPAWLVSLSETGGNLRASEALTALTDLELRIEGGGGKVYAKVINQVPGDGGTFMVRFTSMNKDVRVLLRELVLRAGAAT